MNIDMEGIYAQIYAAQRPLGRGLFCLPSVGWHRVQQGWKAHPTIGTPSSLFVIWIMPQSLL